MLAPGPVVLHPSVILHSGIDLKKQKHLYDDFTKKLERFIK